MRFMVCSVKGVWVCCVSSSVMVYGVVLMFVVYLVLLKVVCFLSL